MKVFASDFDGTIHFVDEKIGGSFDLTVFGQLKALFCTGVGFQLRHFIFLLNVITAY